jgi:hypothetical protein
VREEPDALGFSPCNPVLQSVVGMVATVPLAIILTSMRPRLADYGAATMLLIWSGLAARAAACAWRTRPRGRAVWNEALRLRIIAGTTRVATMGLAGALAILAF